MPIIALSTWSYLLRGNHTEALRFAAAHEVVLALENLGHSRDSLQRSYTDLVGWVDQVGHPNLQVCLDVGHPHLEGGAPRAFEALGPYVRHIHLNDNDGRLSEHAALGSGSIDWAGLAPALRAFDGMLSLEVLDRHDAEGAILASQAFLERLLEGR